MVEAPVPALVVVVADAGWTDGVDPVVVVVASDDEVTAVVEAPAVVEPPVVSAPAGSDRPTMAVPSSTRWRGRPAHDSASTIRYDPLSPSAV